MKTLIVKVWPHPYSFDDEDYPLKAQMLDKESGRILDQEITFRDMRSIRSYYNGMTAGWGLTHNHRDGIVLHYKDSYRGSDIFAIPVNMEYDILPACDGIGGINLK